MNVNLFLQKKGNRKLYKTDLERKFDIKNV